MCSCVFRLRKSLVFFAENQPCPAFQELKYQGTCKVKGEAKQQKSSEEVAEEGDHSAGDALRNRVNRLNEQLQEDGHTTVDEDTHQDAGGVESG